MSALALARPRRMRRRGRPRYADHSSHTGCRSHSPPRRLSFTADGKQPGFRLGAFAALVVFTLMIQARRSSAGFRALSRCHPFRHVSAPITFPFLQS